MHNTIFLVLCFGDGKFRVTVCYRLWRCTKKAVCDDEVGRVNARNDRKLSDDMNILHATMREKVEEAHRMAK